MFNELIKNVMNLGIITEDDVKRLTAIELMMLIIERSNGLLQYLNSYVEDNDQRLLALDSKYKQITDDIKNLIKDNETYFNEVIKENLSAIALEQLNDWLTDGTLESLINDTALANISKRVDVIEQNQSYISPKQTNGDVQSAIDLAVTKGVRKVVLEPKTYVVNDTVLVPSNFTLEGIKGVSTIKMVGVDKPVIGKKGGIESATVIKNINVIGDTSLSNNHGIVINDFWSTVEGCEIKSCGGNGIRLSSENASGTLVENRIKDCIVRDCGSYSFYLGDENNKLTDGYLVDCISNGNGSNGALFVGSSAGWTIDGLHTYNHGGTSGVIAVLNAFNTTISNLYVEDFKDTCISLTKIQRNLNLSNISVVNSDTENSTKIFNLNKSSSFSSQANVNISNLSVTNDVDKYVTVIAGDGTWVVTNVSNLSLSGGKADKIIGCAENMKNNTSITRNINVDGKLDIKGELIGTSTQLVYGGWTQARYRVGTFSGNEPVTIKVNIPGTYEYGRTLCRLTMYSRLNFDGEKSVNYSADIYLTRKGVGTSFITTNELTPTSGFTSAPSYSFDVNTGDLTITFTPASSSGQGIWKFELFD